MRRLLYAVFALSGAAGLIYESIWTRYLGLFVGHSAYAQVLVLVIFLGGMSLGALLIGRRSERMARPLYWYAIVELATGVIGLAFHDVFVAVTNAAYDTIFPAVGLGVAQTIVKWGLAALLILPQSILLGTTFPLMSAGVVRRMPRQAGRALALLYFTNSLGAAAGVLLAGFWFVAVAGLPGTLLIAAMINITVAGIVIVAIRTRAESETAAPAPIAAATERVPGAARHRLLLAVSFGTALSSFIYEIGWNRMLALVLGSATHSFELMLSAFILGLALGAWWIRRRADRADRAGDAVRLLGIVQVAMGSLAIATLPVYLHSFYWMVDLMAAFAKTPQGYALFSVGRYALCLSVMLPATFCAGMTLPLITRVLVGGGAGERAIGQVYGVNTLGSIVGAGLAGLVLMPLLGLKWLLVAGASIDLVLGVVLLAPALRAHLRTPSAGWLPRASFVGALALALLAIAVGADFDPTMLTSGVYRYGGVQKPHSRKVLFYKDGRTATVSVRLIPETGGLTLGTNGKPDASLGPEWFDGIHREPGPFTHDAPTQLFIPLVALAHAPAARNAAVIGFGSGMTTHALLGSPALRSVVTIEIEPEMVRASRAFYPANRRAYDDPRSSIAIDDARSYFAASGRRFDLIVSEPSNPWVSGVSSLFTTEFYGRVRSYLAPGGVFAQWLHLYEIDDGLVLGVLSALSQHFPSYAIFQISNRDILIVATAAPQLPAPDWSIFRYPTLAGDMAHAWPVTPSTMEALRVADASALAPLVRAAGEANSDFYPTLDLNAERTRYMTASAIGFAGLPNGRVNVAAIMGHRRLGLGDSYAVVDGVPRLHAMAVAAGMRDGDPRAGFDARAAAAQKQALDEGMALGQAPVDWHAWISAFEQVDATLHGGMAGVADTAFYARTRAFLARVDAPAGARATVDFRHGIASWDFAEAARASDVLLAAMTRSGELWLDPAELRDGAVMAKLAVGDRAGAADAFRLLTEHSAQSLSDLRTRLLFSYIMDTTAVRLARR